MRSGVCREGAKLIINKKKGEGKQTKPFSEEIES